MDATNRPQAAAELDGAHASRDELVERIARAIRDDGTAEPLDGLRLRRASAPTELGHGVSYPAFCVIAQGSKEILLGDHRYRYDPAHYLIATAALPIASRITEASPERPYLSLVLKLDPTLVGSVMVEAGHPAPRSQSAVTAIDVSPLDAGLLDAVVRLVRLLDCPDRRALPRAADHAGDRLPAPAGRAGRPARSHRGPGRRHPPHRRGRRAAAERLRPAAAHRGHRARAGDERLGLPPPLQGGHRDEPACSSRSSCGCRRPAG